MVYKTIILKLLCLLICFFCVTENAFAQKNVNEEKNMYLSEQNIIKSITVFHDYFITTNEKGITLAVCDKTGLCIFLLKMEKAPHLSYNIAKAKAKTSAVMRVSTRDFHERLINENLKIEDFAGSGTTGLTGGVPIIIDGECIGGIGISGCKPDIDEMLAYKFRDYLVDLKGKK